MALRLVPVLIVIAALAAPALGRQTSADISGVYACEGIGPEGAPYRGVVEIARYYDTYRVRWAIPPNDAYGGVGLVTGDAFAVSYFGRAAGLVVYKIGDGTRMTGSWTVAGADGKVYSETLTKLTGGVRRLADSPPRPAASRPGLLRAA